MNKKWPQARPASFRPLLCIPPITGPSSVCEGSPTKEKATGLQIPVAQQLDFQGFPNAAFSTICVRRIWRGRPLSQHYAPYEVE